MSTSDAVHADPLEAEVGYLTPELRDDLVRRWNEPVRRYHNETHLRAVLRAVDLLEHEGETFDGTAVRLAGWFHAAVYDPAGTGNEEASARLAESSLDPAAPVEEVARLVRMTSGHRVEEGDTDAAVLSDADLSILGAEPDTYDAYAADVRHEFAHVPGERYTAGRRAVVEALLERPQLFVTAAGRDEWEKQARANLHRELAALGGPPR